MTRARTALLAAILAVAVFTLHQNNIKLVCFDDDDEAWVPFDRCINTSNWR